MSNVTKMAYNFFIVKHILTMKVVWPGDNFFQNIENKGP